MLRVLGILLFVAGLAFGIRVMFFGVQRKLDAERTALSRWPLATASVMLLTGFLFYVQSRTGREVTALWFGLVALVAIGVAIAAWLFVKRSSETPSTDPEDDPRYRFQGHVARIVEPFVVGSTAQQEPAGKIAFEFESRAYALSARWSPGSESFAMHETASVGAEVVIEYVDGDVAFVEPWHVVEKRL